MGEDPAARPGRRAVVVALDGRVEALVDAVRRRFDPLMAARIGAHVTLVHDVVDAVAADAAVAEVAATTRPFAVTLTGTACWGPPRWGSYVQVADPGGSIGEIHERLAVVEDPRWLRTAYRPHVTLVHVRTVAPADAERAWEELAGWRLDRDVCVDALTVLELGDERWEPVACHRLGGGTGGAGSSPAPVAP